MRLPSTDRGAIDRLKNHFSKVQIAERDGDLDRDPYTSAAWDGDSFSTSVGTIDWVVDFGLPEIPKMVWLVILIRDEDSELVECTMRFKAVATTTNWSIYAYADRSWNDQYHSTHAPVAVNDNGTTRWSIVASGANTMDVIIRVVAWER